MKSLTYAAFIVFVTMAAAAAQSSGTTSSSNVAPSANSGQITGKSAATPRAERNRVEDRITAQLNRQQLANLAASATATPRSTVPQTAAQPTDCAPGQADCSSGAMAQ